MVRLIEKPSCTISGVVLSQCKLRTLRNLTFSTFYGEKESFNTGKIFNMDGSIVSSLYVKLHELESYHTIISVLGQKIRLF